MGAQRRCRLQHQVPDPDPPAEAAPRQVKLEVAKPIVVGDNVWLGGGVVVGPGVGSGEHRGQCWRAGTRDLRANVFAVANPACVIHLL
jgi:maltose O-acetyltransferase